MAQSLSAAEQQQLTQEFLKLLEENRYNPQIMPELEKFVDVQVEHNFFVLESNLALLKLYQFFPEDITGGYIEKIFLKAQMRYPSTDYLLCCCLVPEKLQSQAPLNWIRELSNYLESASFEKFWEEASKHGDLIDTIPGYHVAIRQYIAYLISISYQSLKKETLSKYLHLEGEEFAAFVKTVGWTITADGLVKLPLTEDNQAKGKQQAESFPLDQLGRLLAYIQNP
eukprot:TRINITY_DN7840_c0_g2_i1.p1 TRINITY_DN7840_c0_g2~~TRINITY_DN7840_c0_g2_i1.p1  ORF type:complete len:226 (-),score=63.49 TRINITY_DN7840_c0_g2_i1:193-870(-)